MSRGKEMVKKWLEDNEFEFQREVTFENLKAFLKVIFDLTSLLLQMIKK